MVRRHKLLGQFIINAERLLIVVLAAFATFAPLDSVTAVDLMHRKITIGSPQPSQTTSHTYNFDIASASTVGSIEFEYCDDSPIIGTPCVAPPGLDLSGVTLAGQTGETGFSIHSSTNANSIIITRTPAMAAPQPVMYRFDNAVNPSAPQDTFYVRISTYATDDGTGPRVDSGSVAFATVRSLSVTGYVPPFLTFCVGVTVANDCSATDGDFIDFGELLRTLPSVATSEFAGATNDVTGYYVSVHGNTMTSGNSIIPALGANGPSAVGTSQYGLNLRRNTTPSVGQNSSGTGTAVASGSYSIPNSFRFVSGETIASSPLPTEYNKFTVSYLINVSNAQQPGVYATTMTYVATASF